MNEAKGLTLDEAKAEITELKRMNSGHCYVNDCLKQVLSILARVEQPSEEDMAVLWLIKENGYDCAFSPVAGWNKASGDDWNLFNPTEEARGLGWKP